MVDIVSCLQATGKQGACAVLARRSSWSVAADSASIHVYIQVTLYYDLWVDRVCFADASFGETSCGFSSLRPRC